MPETNKTEEEKEEIKVPEDKLEEIREEKEELKDKYLRALANYENLRKRALQEKEKIYKFTSEEIFRKILPIIDDFKRAFESLKESKKLKDDYKSFSEGMRLVYSNLKSLLESYGIEDFTSKGEKFDPSKHEAVHVIEADDEKEGEILEETETGYKIKDRVLRPAKVIVAKKTEKSENKNEETNKNQGGETE